MKYFVFVCALVLFGLSGCQNKARSPYASQPAVEAAALIGASFSVPAADLQTGANNSIRINKAALEKEFLLQVGLIQQEMLPLGSSLRSRIVSFRLVGDKVFLLEATQGHNIDPNLPQTLIIASFPVLEDGAESVAFDFNSGMTSILQGSDWKASDFDGAYYQPDFFSLPVKNSFLSKVELSGNRLAINQLASYDVSVNGMTYSGPLEVRYYLSPYRVNEGFSPTESLGFERMGFFETGARINENGDTVMNATKFDLRKPIVFAISDNTPPEFREAVREGILYFNKALGNKIQVIDAPKGLTAPNPDYNIVQWVKWDKGFGAYADAQMDPRTGEILHAQVYFASVFGHMGKRSVRKALADAAKKSGLQFNLRGFAQLPGCAHQQGAEFRAKLQEFLASDPSDEAILRLAQDQVRDIVAHEIGHTLGLRHNFAGSLHANTGIEEKVARFDGYLRRNEGLDGLIVSSSVMDYNTFEDSVISGYQLKHAAEALSYDDKALKYLYFGTKPVNMPLFCTDTHADGRYADCLRGDQGRDVVESSAFANAQAFKRLAGYTLESLLIQKEYNRPGQRFYASPEGSAWFLMMPRLQQISYLLAPRRMLEVDRSFPDESPLYERERKTGYERWLGERFAGVGGFTAAFSAPETPKLADVEREYQRLLNERAPVEKLSAEEVAELREVGTKMFAALPAVLLRSQLENFVALTETLPIRDSALGEDVAEAFGKLSERVIFDSAGSRIQAEIELPQEGGGTKRVSVSLPVYKNEHADRVLAARLLQAKRGSSAIWGLHERTALMASLKKQMDESLRYPSEKLSAGTLPKPVARWLVENQKVLATFAQ